MSLPITKRYMVQYIWKMEIFLLIMMKVQNITDNTGYMSLKGT